MANHVDPTATIAVAPGADGYGLVDWRDARRRCYFPPPLWGSDATAAGWGAASAGGRVAVAHDGRGGLVALARVGHGTPAYTYTAGA